MSGLRGLGCVSLSLLMATGAHAQVSASPEERVDESARAAGLDEIIVTAQRREQRIQDVPFTVAAMSASELEKAGVTNIFDIQTVVSGIASGGAGNYTQPAIRGVSTGVSTSGAENPNSLYVDGIYFKEARILNSNLPDVERIEVLKGPQGTLFGRQSMGGAIRIFTKDPGYVPAGDFNVDLGLFTGSGTSRSAPRVAVRGFVSLPLVDQMLAISLSGAYDRTKGWMTDDATGEQYGVVKRENARSKILFEPSPSVRLLLSAFYLKHDDRGVQAMTPLRGLVAASAYAGSIVPTVPFHTAFDRGFGLDFDVADAKSYGFSGNLSVELGAIGTLTSTTAWHDSDTANLTTITHSVDAPACLAVFACTNLRRFVSTEAFTQEINFASERFGMFRLTAGLFYFDQINTVDVHLNASVIPDGGRRQSSEVYKVKSYAAYGEVEVSPTDSVTLILGGRYTHEPHHDTLLFPAVIERRETFNSFVPRVSIKYDFSPRLNGYATFSKGSSSGLTGINNAGSIPPRAPVKPEELTAYEIGLKYADATLAFNIAGYYYDYKNKQEQAFTGTATILQNTGPVRIYGVDADLSVRISPDLKLRLAATWVPKAEYRDFPDAVAFNTVRTATGGFTRVVVDASGDRLIRAPELTANIGADYEHETARGAKIDASFNLSYSSAVSQDILQILRQSPYATLSARAGYTLPDGRLRLGLYGRNLTNQTYISHAFGSGVGFTVNYARPREVGLSLGYGF